MWFLSSPCDTLHKVILGSRFTCRELRDACHLFFRGSLRPENAVGVDAVNHLAPDVPQTTIELHENVNKFAPLISCVD